MTTLDTIQLDQLDARIKSVWVREQKLHLIGGLLALLRWAVPMFLVFVLIDWLSYMPSAGRVVMLVVLLAVSLQRAWVKGWRELRPFDAVRTALKIESQHDGLGSLLVSAIQLRSQPTAGDSSAMRSHTFKLAEEAALTLRPKETVPYQPLKNPGYLALSAAGLIVVFAAINGPFLTAGLARIFAPWVDIEYPTNTQIVLEQDQLVIKEGDQAEIVALLEGEIPDNAIISVRTGDSRPRNIDLEVNDGQCVYTIASASRDFDYRIKAGDDRTKWQTVRVIPSPRIKTAKVELAYPDYLGKPADTIEALTLTAPEGTTINWDLTLDRPVSSARFVRVGEEPIALPISGDGLKVTFSAEASASQGYNFEWVEKENGYTFTSPRYYLQVASDQEPRVELTSPESNIVAMLGRPMNLAARVQDDHGIGSAQIVYRVNQHSETVLEIDDPSKKGQGEQPIDWDYRQTLPDLAVGDTLSFALTVSDKYPGENGPHTVRSETRRITFLSKADYLEQIEKQKDRLLSRVQAIYRQQRAAHTAVLELSPAEEGYLQACQLEAIRQEMIRDQLKEIAGGIQALLDDLAANGIADALEADSLEAVRAALIDIAEKDIARAANLLREQATGGLEASETARADHAVNTAARRLGNLVLLRSIESAVEVFARESRMLAQSQASLRWFAATRSTEAAREDLGDRQEELATWTDELIAQLQANMHYDKKPLAVLRLVRSLKDLQNGGTSATMREAGSLIRAGETAQAIKLQAGTLSDLLNAEFSVRLSAAFTTMVRTRDQLTRMIALQASLSAQAAELSDQDFAQKQAEFTKQQTELRRSLLTLMLPTVPAPRSQLYDERLPLVPPVEALINTSDKAMSNALAAIGKGERGEALEQQQQAEAALAALAEIVTRRATEVGLETQGMSTVVAASSDRVARIQDFEARLIDLLDRTDLTAADDKNVSTLAEAQLALSEDISDFYKELAQAYEADVDSDLPPLLGPLAQAEQAANAAVQALKDNNADDAIGYQETSADALAIAFEVASEQSARLGVLQSLLLFQRSVAFANNYMADIVAEQRELLDATEAAEPEAMKALLPQFNHMRESIFEVAPILNLVAARMDVGTPMAFAQTDFEDAVTAVETADKFEAIDAQDVAAESLADVQVRVGEMRVQTGYIAEIVASMHNTTSDTALLKHLQTELLNQALLEDADVADLTKAQNALLQDAQRLDQLIDKTAGQPKLVLKAEPNAIPPLPERQVPALAAIAEPMQDAAKQLSDGDAEAAAEPMELAEAVLTDNAVSFFTILEMLEGLPQATIDSLADPALIRLINVLELASQQRHLSRTTRSAEADALAPLAEQQKTLTDRCKAIATEGEPHPLLTKATEQLTEALAAFAASDPEKLASTQQSADTLIRHYIIEQSLILNTKIPPPVPSDSPGDSPDGSDTEDISASGFVSDFVSGEAPEDKSSEWKVFGERNRAALNQNFARELPLEYRALLKDYYERVAR